MEKKKEREKKKRKGKILDTYVNTEHRYYR